MIGGGFAASAIFTLTDLVSGPLGRIQAQLRATGAAGGGLSSQMGQLAVAMTPVVLAAGAVAGALGMAAREAIGFESAMADVAKVVNFESAEEMQAMSDSILDMSARIPMAAKGLAAIAAAAGQTGMAKADVLGFTEQAAKMGVAFDLTGDQAGEMMAAWRSGMNLSLDRVYALADATNHLSNNMNAKAPALGEVIQRVGAVGMASGLTETQVAALGAAFLSAGASPEVAATALKKFTTTLVKGASMSKDAQTAFSSLGLSATQMAKDMQTDAQGTIFKVLQALADKPKELQMSLLTEMFGEEAIGAIAPLLANMGNLSKAFNLVGDSSAYAGSMQAEFDARSKTTENALLLLGNKLKALLIVVGSYFLPIISGAAEALGAVADVLRVVAQSAVGEFALKFVAGISAAVLVVATLAAGSWALSAAIPFLSAALAPLAAAIAAISWPVWALAAAVTGLYLAWKTNFGGMRDRLTAFWTTASLVARGVMAVFQSLTGSVGEVRGQLAEDLEAAGLVGAVTTLGRVVYRAWQLILGVWDVLSEGFRAMWAMLAPWFGLAASAIGGLIGLAGRLGLGLGLLAETTGADSWRVFGRALGLAMAAIAGGLALVKGFALAMSLARAGAVAWTAAQWLLNVALNANPIGLLVIAIAAVAAAVWYFWEPISSFVASLWDRVVGLWQAGVRTVAGWWDGLAAAVRAGADLALSVWDGLGAVVATLLAPLQAILDLIGRVLAAFGGFSSVGDLIEGAVSGLGGLLSGAAGLTSGALSGLGDLAGRTASGIGGLVSDAASGLGVLAAGAASGMGDLASGATAALTNFFGGADLSGAGAALLGSLGQGVQAGAAALADSVTGGLGAALDGLTGLGERAAGLFASAPAAIADLFGGIDLFASGAAILDTLWQGVQSRAGALYEGVASVFAQVRNLLPFSDAKEGPLSQLTLSGSRIMTTLGEGVAAGAPELTQATSDALAGVAGQLATPLTGPGIAPVQAQIPTVGLAGPLLADPVVPAASPGPAALSMLADPVAGPTARVGGLFAGLAGGQPAPEPQAGPSLAAMLAPPTANDGGDPVRPLAQPPASATTNRRSLIIQSLSVTLPGVSDAKDFVADLQRLVEEYDAPGDPAEA